MNDIVIGVLVWYGMAWHGMAGHCMIRYGI